MHLMSTEKSWLIVIPDIDSSRSNVSSLANLLNEGENISFIYNTTKASPKCSVSLYYKIIIKKMIIKLVKLVYPRGHSIGTRHYF